MGEKVRIVMELDKNVVQTACFLADINLSDEVWQKMVAEPILFPMELAGEQKKEMARPERFERPTLRFVV